MKYCKSRKKYNLMRVAALGMASLSLAFASCNSTTKESDNAATDEAVAENEQTNTESAMIYVGTYAGANDESIFLYSLNSETGELTRKSAAKGGENPSFLTLDEERRYLYAVNETMNYDGKESGAVSAFAIDEHSGRLNFLNRIASQGGAPCHISIDKTGKTVLVANYMGGNVAAYQIQESGQLSQAKDVKQHEGSGPNKDRQEAAHAHYIAPDPENKFALAVDLGTDKVMSYRLDAANGTLTPNEPAVAYATKPGAGPRHLDFHPNGRYAYLINELNSTMEVLAYDAEKGTFTGVQAISTIPSDFTENNQCAEVKVSSDGKFLYGSNRGHNSMVVYSIDENSGELKLVEHVNTGGDWPRDFSLDPSENILVVANERSNNIVSFKRDKSTGKLTATGHRAEVSKPVCVQVVQNFLQ
ncbi:lactonase family protein [Pontibacter harenae]|uniref:lactonase family protein n=1 Tax=Pontibacter harenae TaxID=2894083 RepID=UPI001E295E6C|nr:lactonase family protein [Pontibacter harenae]MCC9166744.1 lactonase family protein [Pontibacter harenae]